MKMKKNIIGSLILGVLFLLHFINAGGFGSLKECPEPVRIAVCGSLFLLPMIFGVMLCCNVKAVLYGIPLVLTVLAAVIPFYMPFVFSLHYLPALYLMAFFNTAVRNKKDGITDKKDVIPLFAADMLCVGYVILLLLSGSKQDNVVLPMAFLAAAAAFLVYRLMFRRDAKAIQENMESEIWFHYIVSLAVKLLFLVRADGWTDEVFKVAKTFYHYPVWMFMPDFLFLICMIQLSSNKKLNLNFITESMSEN